MRSEDKMARPQFMSELSNHLPSGNSSGIIARALVCPSPIIGADADLSFLDGSDFDRTLLADYPIYISPVARRTEL